MEDFSSNDPERTQKLKEMDKTINNLKTEKEDLLRVSEFIWYNKITGVNILTFWLLDSSCMRYLFPHGILDACQNENEHFT